MMKKVLTASLFVPLLAAAIALPVLATTTGANDNMHVMTNAPKGEHGEKKAAKKADRMAKVNGACMATAVDKRDTAIIAAVDASSAAVKAALTTRRDALKAAWALTDGRSDALKAAWTAYRTAATAARKTLRTARQSAWKTFRTEAKACGSAAVSADAGGEGVDSQL